MKKDTIKEFHVFENDCDSMAGNINNFISLGEDK